MVIRLIYGLNHSIFYLFYFFFFAMIHEGFMFKKKSRLTKVFHRKT